MEHQLLSQKDVKETELEILKEIKAYCQKTEIPFFLGGGTLLGAIRHKGFIPWDDDIDIALFRDDYEKLIRDFESQSGSVKILSMHSSKTHRYAFAKAIDETTLVIEAGDETLPIGIFVDIFPIDSLCDDLGECKKLIRKWLKWKALYQLQFVQIEKSRSWIKNLVLLLIRPMVRIIPNRCFLKKFDKIAKKYKCNQDSTYVANVCGAWGEKEITLRSNFLSTVDVEFEGEMFPAPVGYDAYLRNLYGDYMQLPPVEKRVSHHNYKAYKIIDRVDREQMK